MNKLSFKMLKSLLAVLIIAICILAIGVFFLKLKGGFDYRVYSRTTRDWLNGNTNLYGKGYFYMPWFLLCFFPIFILPDSIGYILWIALSLLSLFYAMRDIDIKWVCLLLLTPPVMAELALGQANAVLLGALALALWAIKEKRPYLLGFCLIILAAKPVNVILPGLWLLYQARKDLSKVVVIPAITGIVSFLLWGLWPLQYWEGYQFRPPNQGVIYSIWRTGYLSIPIFLILIALVWYTWREKDKLNATILANFTITPYYTQPHLVLLIPWLAQRIKKYPWLIVVVFGWLIFWFVTTKARL